MWSCHKALELLLSWGADPEFLNSDGQSAIGMALELGDEVVVKKLEAARAKST